MSTTAELVEIICPKCGEWFTEWRRESEDPATTSRCPHCGFQLSDDHGVWQEGLWLPEADDAELADR
jgi:hypothetical protein